MTLFEYLTVAVSIVLSLSIVRGLDAAGDVLDAKRRYPVHAAWFLLKSFQPALIWWSIWGLHDETGWSFPAFLLCLAGPGLLYFQLTILVIRASAEISDWRAHFYEHRRRFFATAMASAITAPLLVLSLGDIPSAKVISVGTLAEINLATIGFRSDKPRTHKSLVTISAVGLAISTYLITQPLGTTPTP